MTADQRVTGVFPCSVCGQEFHDRNDLVAEITVPLFFYSNYRRILGWDVAVFECKDCVQKFGIPVKVFHRPYDSDIAEFSACTELIVLKNKDRDD